MRVYTALLLVILLAVGAAVAAQSRALSEVFARDVPYAALGVLLGGLAWRILWWARSPVPFRIPTTCGQAQWCDWIRPNRIDNPQGPLAVAGRLALELLLFRSLFRNTSSELCPGPRLVHSPNRRLWLASLVFHYSLLVIVLRHLRLFTEPVPGVLIALTKLDSFLEVGLPPLTLTSMTLLFATMYLLMRRVVSLRLRILSRVGDYFPLLLILAVGTTGLVLRHWVRSDVVSVKELCLSLVAFKPVSPARLPWLLFTHLALVCTLLCYLPFSKLVHMGCVLLSPTRNLANNSRRVRHNNPWAEPAKLHSYQAYEDMFRDKMLKAGIPVDTATMPPPAGSASPEPEKVWR